MRIPVRIIADGCLAGMSALLGMAFDAVLFGVFRSHLRHALAESYRPIYAHSGRRNRVRY
jgi:hypothetical protein